MIELIVAPLVAVIDSFFKEWAEKNLSGKGRKKLGKTGFSLELTHNYGFACNGLDKKPGLVKALHSLVLIVLFLYSMLFVFFQKGRRISALALGLLLGGGMSNLYDRLKRGYVVDYLGLPKIKKLLFNLSDLCVFLGGALLLLGELLER